MCVVSGFYSKKCCSKYSCKILWAETSISPLLFLSVEYLKLIISECLNFQGTAKLFSHLQSHEQYTSTPYPYQLNVSLFGQSHSSRRVIVSHCGFDLHFPNDSWYQTSFCMLIYHPYIFLVNYFVRIFCPFLIESCVVLLCFESSSHSLDIYALFFFLF